MKTTITLTKAEAQERLALKMSDDLPYSDNEVVVLIEDESVYQPAKLSTVSKISLIKMVRHLGEEVLNNKIKISRDINTGKNYIGLAEAKKFVEDHLYLW